MYRILTKRADRGGFTLIELLIVVAIIAILAAIAVPNFLEAQVRAKVSRAKSDMRSLATGIEAYRVDNTKYPPITAPTSPAILTNSPGSINGPSVIHNGAFDGISSRFVWLTTPVAYLTSVFVDPFINQNVKFALNCNAAMGPLPTYDTYDYVDSDSFGSGGAMYNIFGSSQANRVGSVSSGAAWQVVSAGPDLMNCYGGGQSTYTIFERANGQDYDPTNGTVSSGDIVRVGGVQSYAGTTLTPTIDRVKNIFLAVP